MRATLCLMLLLTIASAALGQALETRIFQLNNRPAEGVVQVVAPVLSSQGTVLPEPRLQRLIVRDLPENLQKVEELLAEIDQAAPHVSISVWMEGQSTSQGHLIAIDRKSGTAVLSDGQASANTAQTLLVMSGERGLIVMARDVVTVDPYLRFCQGYNLVPTGLVVNSVNTGFAVEPVVVGAVVRMKITPWMSFLGASGRVEVLADEASTQIALRSGQEQTLSSGSSDQSFRREAYGLIFGSLGESTQSSGSITVKPEIVEL